jgi:hypothetical protein
MKIDVGTSIAGDWAKVGTHIKDQDRLQIKNAGQILEGQFGPQMVFKVLTKKKEELNLAMNRTSQVNLSRAYGKETEEWVDKVAKCYVIKQMVGDGLKSVLYLVPDGWEMNDDGEVINPNEEGQAQSESDAMIKENNPFGDNIPF